MAKRKPSPVDPDDVLAGRTKPAIDDLLQLIHQENPTGRDLGVRDAERRYSRKSRLQSLLVRHFGDALDVDLDASNPGTVLLRHRGSGRDGCHAVLASLDEDARAWVQLQLDLAVSASTDNASPAARPKARPVGREAKASEETQNVESLLRQAETAADEYDYPGAQSALEQALHASDGAVEPAVALLALLVDTLGDDTGALAIEPLIAPAALENAQVRGFLAIAAARTSLEAQALSLVRGIDDAQAATVLALLAANALRQGDASRAAAHLEEAKERDATCEAIGSVAADLAKARAAERGPVEAEVTALMLAGRTAEAAKVAEQVLARWPESEVARRARRAMEEQRRSAESAQRVADAEQAVANGEALTALAKLTQAAALATGSEREAIERRAREIEAAERERRDAEQVRLVIGLLEGSNPDGGLERYAGLEDALRARVRTSSALPELEWIDRMASVRGTERSKVAAATALERAQASLPSDPEAALALLTPHQTLLERVPEARRLISAAETAVRAVKHALLRSEIGKARAALAGGAAQEALATLEVLSLRELPEEDRAEATALRGEATRLSDRHRREEEVGRLRASGRLSEARSLAEGLAESAEDAQARSRWERKRDDIRAEIQRTFRVSVDSERRSSGELGRFRPQEQIEESPWWLTADGRGIVFARSYNCWVVVRVVEVSTLQVTTTVSFRTPEPLESPGASVCGNTLWLAGERGAIVELAMDGWEIRDFRPSAEVATPSEVVETAIVVASVDRSASPHFWVACRAGRDASPERLRIYDLDRRRLVRELQGSWDATPIAGLGDARVITTKDEVVTMHSARGVVVPPGRIEVHQNADQATANRAAGTASPKFWRQTSLSLGQATGHPSGEGLAALVTESWTARAKSDTDGPDTLHLATLSPEGKTDTLMPLPGASPNRPSSLAAARGSGCIHAISTTVDGTTTLSCLTSGSDRALSAGYEVRAGSETVLIQDAGARRVMALTVHDDGVDAVELGPVAPTLPVRPPRLSVYLPGLQTLYDCSIPSGERNAAALALAVSWRDCQDGEIFRRTRELERTATRAEELLDAVYALRKDLSEARKAEARQLVQRLSVRFPDHREVRLLMAHEHASAQRWRETNLALTGVDTEGLDDQRSKHLHHLQALSALGEGRLDDFKQHVHASVAFDGLCDMIAFAALAEPSDGGTPTRGVQSLLALIQLTETISASNAFLEAGDHAGAVRELDSPAVWFAHERQSLARLAEAHLALATGTRIEHLRKLEALGTLLDVLGRPDLGDRNNLRVRGAWDAQRIAEVASRARAWLDAQGAGQEGEVG